MIPETFKCKNKSHVYAILRHAGTQPWEAHITSRFYLVIDKLDLTL